MLFVLLTLLVSLRSRKWFTLFTLLVHFVHESGSFHSRNWFRCAHESRRRAIFRFSHFRRRPLTSPRRPLFVPSALKASNFRRKGCCGIGLSVLCLLGRCMLFLPLPQQGCRGRKDLRSSLRLQPNAQDLSSYHR